jgi:hypothetical protein
MDTNTHLAKIIETARQHPQTSRVRYRINSGEWQLAKGVDFLMLWDQPFAGTISVDYVVVVPDLTP